ncbi:hypothetical protein FACS1894166_12620 [Bacilli bacterium]|nr:hypothetical protein FACS1894166_12620 [Bacilli bacterium]
MQEINLTQFLDIRNNTIFGFDRFINGQVLKDIIAKNPDALYVIGDERTKKIAMGAFDYVFNEDNFNIKNIKIHHKIATLENMAIMHSRSLQNVYFDSPNLALPNTFCYDFSSGNPINFHFHPENKPNYLVLVSIVDYGHSVSHPAVQRQQTPTGA